LAVMSVWIVFFGAMTALRRTDARHTGDSLPFWQQACEEGRRNACERLIQLESTYCGDNSGWACNELGSHYMGGRITDADSGLAAAYFSRACEVRFQAGCVNVLDPGSPSRVDPRILDLRLLLREGGQNLMEMPEQELYARACDHSWTFACGGGCGHCGCERGVTAWHWGAATFDRRNSLSGRSGLGRFRMDVAPAATARLGG